MSKKIASILNMPIRKMLKNTDEKKDTAPPEDKTTLYDELPSDVEP